MQIDQWTIVAIFICTIAALIRFQKVPERVFAASTLACLGYVLVDMQQVLANAVNPGLVTLLLLVVCAQALERTRFLRHVSGSIFNGSQSKSMLKALISTLFASAFFNNTAVVAALLDPVKKNQLINPNKLLLPLSYAAILGGTLTLIGTSTNLIVNSMLLERGQPSIGFWDFMPVGLLTAILCLVVIFVSARKLSAGPSTSETDPEYFVEAEVLPDSPLIGKSVEKNNLRSLESLFLVEVIRGERLLSPVSPAEILQQGDKLIFSGDIKKVMVLNQFKGLSLFAHADGLLKDNLTEVVVRPGASIVGKSLKQAGFRARFDAAVVAIRREGAQLSGKLGEMKIQAGDFLVLAVGPDFASRSNIAKNFFVLSGVKAENMLSGWREQLTLYGFVGALASSLLFNIDLLTSFVFYLALLVACNVLSLNDLKRRFPLELWLIVTSALTLATALDNSGVSTLVGELVQHHLSDASVYFALVGVFLITLLLTELITNNAAAALVFPIAYTLAQGLGVSYLPFVFAVAFAASGSFVSPYGYQTNLMVFNAGNYTLKDFVKFGLPVSLTYSISVLLLIPVFFPF
ncbi:SLC13 family permease [Pseudoalteromonas sp. YIC-827]|uniref:SLC13 family permease n=1 Tax=Pseudoalteromonas qingdaonensis TaxID=3131913 RepID=A0ABU9MSC6_9GAMM